MRANCLALFRQTFPELTRVKVAPQFLEVCDASLNTHVVVLHKVICDANGLVALIRTSNLLPQCYATQLEVTIV